MKVLLISSTAVDTSDVPFFLERAFREAGAECRLVGPYEDTPLVEKALYRAGLRYSWMGLTLLGHRVLAAAAHFQPDAVLVYGSNQYVRPSVLATLKHRFGCVMALWEGNLQFWRWFQGEALKHYDICFVLDTYAIPLLLGPAQVPRCMLLGAACDPREHRPLDLSPSDRDRFDCDVVTVGSGFPDRLRLFERLAEFKLGLWGRYWDRSPQLSASYHSEPVYGLKKTKIYSAAKIVINLQNPISQINGVSCRIFETLACGSLPVTEHRPDLDLYLEPDREVVAYRGEDELVEKVRYYLAHPAERESIIQRGRERVLREHTYEHRVDEMLKQFERLKKM